VLARLGERPPEAWTADYDPSVNSATSHSIVRLGSVPDDGGGGMGEVYRAQHALLRRPTAIKLLAGDVSETQLRRFEREVQLTALLTHPNTISIYDFGRTPDGRFYCAMELLDGMTTLQELVDDYGAQAPGRVVHILLQACAALREAHGAGLIHRDIKPANIMLCKNGGLPDVIKVLDFGLVKQVSGDGDAALSNTNVLVGTPLYMCPEAIAAPDRMDARGDLYALGAVGYFLLTGAPVFSAPTIVEICGLHLHQTPEPIARRSGRSISTELECAVLDCLAKDPAAPFERSRACRAVALLQRSESLDRARRASLVAPSRA
jgi:serine/threonine protein kinase